MKKTLVAVFLVAVMLLSCIAPVGAASMTLAEYLEFCESEMNTKYTEGVGVPVKIEGKLAGGTYSNLVTGSVGDSAVFHAVLDMVNVKYVVNKILTEGHIIFSDDAPTLEKLKDMPVTGSFTIKASWTGVNPPADIKDGNLAGFTFDGIADDAIALEDKIFVEGASRTPGANSVTATISVKSGVTVGDLTSLPNKIVLEVDGFTITSDGQMNGEITGSTTIGVGGTGYTNDVTVNYSFTDPITPVDINVETPSSGGSSLTYYTLKYESNGGTAFKNESITKGSVVQLDKVPEREGYIFDGWYADAELTQKITSVKMDKDITVYAGWKVVHPVPEMLNGEEHFAYLSGYPDGTIRPESNITRAEVATIFFRLLKDEIREQYLTTENVFADINEGDWYNTAISTMAKIGVVNGRSADTFAPDEYITRAEFTTICARFDDANSVGENKFTDVSDHWAEDYILEAVAYNWIDGYEDYTFRPEEDITRAETATLINRVLNRVPENADALLDSMKVWPDNADAAWYYIAMQEATNSHTYERVNAINEKWLELAENRDWTVYEK